MEKKTENETEKFGKEENEKAKLSLKDYDFLANSVSAADCTGLLHRTPQNDRERENYEAVYAYEPPIEQKKERK